MPEKPPTLRERQAQRTRDEILAAARRLFAEQGYTRTSVRDIAQAAGVSSQTVYDSIGSKAALVARLNDLIDEEAGVLAIVTAARESGDPVRVASLPAAICRSIMEHCGDIIRALVTGAAHEPDLEKVLAEGHRRHVGGARGTADLLQQLGALRPGLTPAAAADTLSALADVQYAVLLQDRYGWSLDELEDWIATTCRALVLAPAKPARSKRA